MPIGNREHEITRVEAPAVIRDDEGEPAPSRAELHLNVLGPAVFHSIGQQFLGRAVDQWLRRGLPTSSTAVLTSTMPRAVC